MSTRFNRSFLTASLLLLVASGCANDPLTGTWVDPDAETLLPDGTPLGVSATLVFDGTTSPGTVDMHLDLTHPAGLTDVVDAHGTYTEDGEALTLSFDGFDIDPASGNIATVEEDGSQCIILMGFGGAKVCFLAPQANAYALEGQTLSITIDQAILGAPVSQTSLALTEAG